MGRPRILAAVSSPSLPVLAELLGGWCELIPALAMRDALERAKCGDIAAVVIGLHFDHSQMPLLLEALKRDAATRDIPVVCCRLRPTLLPHATVRSARAVCDALRAEAFVDVLELYDRAGAMVAGARLRAVLRREQQAAPRRRALSGRPRNCAA
jgi:hypothetical protein